MQVHNGLDPKPNKGIFLFTSKYCNDPKNRRDQSPDRDYFSIKMERREVSSLI
jgi:hypothetical protein